MTKTAVILAARKEHDSPIPYPLVPINEDECLIDRTLRLLHGNGVESVYIVVGYKKELFAKYAKDGVILVENNNYTYTASMASLALARNHVNDDFLLIEGDTFYEQKVIEQLLSNENDTCLSVTEESGNGDEAFVELEHGYLKKTSKDIHQMQRVDGELLGISKISIGVYHRMLRRWDRCKNPKMNYEYMLIDSTEALERPVLFFPNLIWGEVDNQKDLLQLKNYTYRTLQRKENPFDDENLREHLTTIFPGREQEVKDAIITRIGGMSNMNFKVEISNEEYVLRVPGIGSDGMVNRMYEEQNSMYGSKLGLNANIPYFNPVTGIKLTEFIRNAETLNKATIQRPDNMKQIAGIFRKLHNSNIRLNNDFNVFHEIQNYEHLLDNVGRKPCEGYWDVRPQVMALEQKLNSIGVILKPCHNDLVPENFIKDESGRIYLIDWEYSGMNDPMWEFAAMFLESEFTDENQDFVLSEYFKGDIPQSAKEKIFIYQILMDVLWAVWTWIKEAKGDDFGTYGMDRWNRALDNLSKLKA